MTGRSCRHGLGYGRRGLKTNPHVEVSLSDEVFARHQIHGRLPTDNPVHVSYVPSRLTALLKSLAKQ